MAVKDTFGQRAGLEQGEAQQNGIAHAHPDGGGNIVAYGDVLHQHRVDGNADDDEERLKSQRQQAAKIVLAHLPPFTVGHGRHGDGRDACDKVNLDHAPINHDEYADGHSPHGNTHKKALEPQAKQRAEVHRHQLGLQIRHKRRNIYGGVANNNARRAADYALRHIEHAHDDVPCVADDQDGAGRLKDPFEEHPGVHIIHIVLLGDELDQLQRHDKGEYHPRDGQNDGLRQALHHIEDTAVPALGRGADLAGDLAHLRIDLLKQPGEIVDDAAHQNLPQPVGQSVNNKTHGKIPPFPGS